MVKTQTASKPRLYVKGTFLGFKRGRRNTYHHTSLVKVDGVNDVNGGNFYVGKKIAYIYKAPTAVRGSKFRYVWGKITKTHGANGVLRAKFSSNLNPEWVGNSVRVMLYPSTI
jgi:large subunit ribosomal protein L35Ae